MSLLTAKYLGRHVLAEFWRCQRVDDPKRVERALVIAAQAAGATVLQTNLHHFGEGMGVTGVVMLAESHLGIHSWPEIKYAAIGFFLCGTPASNPSAIVTATTRLGLLALGSYVAPSPQPHILFKRHETEPTYCPAYGFKPAVFFMKCLTRAIFLNGAVWRASTAHSSRPEVRHAQSPVTDRRPAVAPGRPGRPR
ncbi:TPA: adenosylmethionine decarboxylase [Pseudomonas aeruginosa]|nr:adenosylmethionine decarboxylase [Pseudomonas aeruginosa]HCR1218499.1 adenosylmethionine decarboxylase [Pseudomonas aeruginosa]HEJ1200749.1 adenosylmethionine decarboxylase [Pseudomonas aeruginosa]HEJ5393547.1 adenosylmethionine decarboxylase [Pseudomonas aeruginosa]